MNSLVNWLARLWNRVQPDDDESEHMTARDMRELERTGDDAETNAPKRSKQAMRRAPERK